jgi:hypothetical protein
VQIAKRGKTKGQARLYLDSLVAEFPIKSPIALALHED